MSTHQQEEYRALRATIRERGTAKIWVVVAGLIGWAALTTATAALASLPVATYLP
jgi:phosphoribosylcarboxyaminoimidazole (NCAIR) mutase